VVAGAAEISTAMFPRRAAAEHAKEAGCRTSMPLNDVL
jgi:hypothetical protein